MVVVKARACVGLLLMSIAATLVGYPGPALGQAVRMPSVRLEVNLKLIWVDGAARSIDVAPLILNDRMYVPFRHLADALGAGIDYDAAERKVTVSLGGTTIELWIDQPMALVNGERKYIDPDNMRVTPVIREDRTMLPLRFVAESLGMEVKWHPEGGSVSLAPRDLPAASTGDRDEPPSRAGWYRVSGTVRDARTNLLLVGVRVVARTDSSTSGSAPGTAEAASGAPSPAPADGSASTWGGMRPSITGKHVLGAPGRADAPADTPLSGGTSGTPDSGAGPPVYEFKAETGEDGVFQLDLPAGAAHRVSLTTACYARQEFLVSVTTRRDVQLEPAAPAFTTPLAPGMYRVYGQVKDQQGLPVSGACVAAAPPAGPGTPVGLSLSDASLPKTAQYMTDDSGTFFVDWPAWKPVKVKATARNCDGKGVQINWGRPPTSAGEGGPVFGGTRSSPEPVAEYMDIPTNPMVAKDLSVICVPPPKEWPLAVTIPAGESGTTVCQQSVGTDSGLVRMTSSAGSITTGQSVDLTASPVGDKSKPVLLRWWLDDSNGGTLYASGCKATYVAPASLGLAYQTSAYVLVAKEGERTPYPGTRIMIYDARNGPGGQAGCTTAPYSVAAHGRHGDITRLDIQGIGTWRSAGAGTLTVTDVPVGRYTIWVTTNGTGTHTLQVQVGCPVTRSYID